MSTLKRSSDLAVEAGAQAKIPARLGEPLAWLVSRCGRFWLLALATALVIAVYALVSHALGFPLDDAWIHQDFARTLAQQGVFAYAPGQSGAGSTSPLWVLLLTPPHLLPGGAPLWLVIGWADALGALALFGLAWATSALVECWLAHVDERLRGPGALAGGISVIADWHLTWAALSGMETIVFVFLSVLLLLGARRAWRPAWLGLLAALLTALRPEGIVLALLVAAFLALRAKLQPQSAVERWRTMLVYPGVLALGLLPLLALNEAAAGHLLPSTFYAKGAFYALGTSEPLRLASYALGVLALLGSSPLVLLALPGAAYALWLARRDWMPGTEWLALLWTVALIGVYAIYLPVVYQNGRYLLPVLPVLLALGVAGSLRFIDARSYRLLPVVLPVLALAMAALSVGRGAGIYAANIRYINAYQVETALWLRANTPPDALVATHDIGAIGYFSGRQVVDLGGLTQPAIVPLLGDQRALVAYLQQRHVAYVVMFPDWFPPPRLLWSAVKAHEVHRVHDPAIAAIGGSDLVTYKTDWGAARAPAGHLPIPARPGALPGFWSRYTPAANRPDGPKVGVYDTRWRSVVYYIRFRM